MMGFCTFSCLVILFFFLLLHGGIALGFPLGNYSYNGRAGRKVKLPFRIISGFYVAATILYIIIYGQYGKVFKTTLDSGFVYTMIIIMCIFIILDFFWAFASKSKKEKLLKTPLLAFLATCSIILLCL